MKKPILRVLTLLLALVLLAGCAGQPTAPAETAGSTPAGTDLPGESTLPADPVPAETLVPAAEVPEVIEVENVAPAGKLEGCGLYVKAVEGLPEDFIFGMDASQVPALEASGVKYYDFDGAEQDVFRILAANGVNYIRVRVWNDPYDAQGNGYGGGNCTIYTALEIGRRATQYGMKLLVDFHYSDFWADPGKQMVPKAWRDLDLEAKAAALETYTYNSLMLLRNAGVDVGMVQVGNETNGALCGETDWPAIVKLMGAGSRAVRAVYPEAKVAVHFANPEAGHYATYATNLKIYELDYDVFGTSYYPYWHGSLENLTTVLSQVKASTGKDVMVLETSYAWTDADSDFSGNTISADSAVDKPYPYTPQGQVNSLRAVTQAVADAGGIGVCYWEGTWIGVGTNSRAENEKLWEADGSGWASSFAGEYDPDDAGKWYGGDAVDNQTFFDPQGRVLEGLMAFNLIRWGNEVELEVQELENPVLRITVGDPLTLPETVDAIMTDNSRVALPVTWTAETEALEALAAKPGAYALQGQAGDLPVTLQLTVEG